MSGKGNCYDNSTVESFFKSLKAELVWRRNWQTRRDPVSWQSMHAENDAS